MRSLVIPPAWTEVWICPYPEGHIQATGRDAKGRKQYIYHPRFREVRDGVKYNHLVAFGEALPAIRAKIRDDMALRGLPRRKVLATVVHLLDTLMERQLDQVAGGLLRKSLEERGMVFKMPAQTQAILGEDRVGDDHARRQRLAAEPPDVAPSAPA